jgi:hypothetical protein
MPGGAGQLSSGGGGQGRGAGAVTAEHSWVAERPQAPYLGEVGPSRGCRRSQGMSGRRPGRSLPVRSSGPPWGCPSDRSSGRPASRCPVSRRPGHPGVRPDRLWCPRRCRRAVRAALDPGVARVAGRPGRAQRVDVPPVRGRGGRLPASGLTGRAWCGGCRCLLAGGSTVARAAAWPATRRRRRLGPGGPTRALVQGQDAGWVAGERGTQQVLTGPAGRPGQVAGVVLTNGPGPRGGDHAVWSLGEGGPAASSSGGPTRFGGGAESVRPRHGRSA